MQQRTVRFLQAAVLAGAAATALCCFAYRAYADEGADDNKDAISTDARRMLVEGRNTFRFDTFGDEDFWGGQLRLHQAIEGSKFGGVGPGVSPATALAVGLKVDAEALPQALVEQVSKGNVDLNDPATTLALLKLNAVLGVTGFFNADGSLKSVGIQCALCHSTVDQSFSAAGIPPGNIGKRLDGWPNRDLNVGAIVSLSPNLQVVADFLGIQDTPSLKGVDAVKKVLAAWGPGKFDAELFLDGKGFRPDGKSVATLIPPAYGLAGFDLHTWTGWGSVTYWNAFVANLEMHGHGRFADSRLNNPDKFPVAVRNHLFDVTIDPEQDRITFKLAALHTYQLSLQAPKPSASGFNFSAQRGDVLFSGKAKCATCHTEPLWTEPGWNMHTASEVCVDDFQAKRSPDERYRTAPLAGLFFRQKNGEGPFYHDGRFATLLDVINHYNDPGCMNLQLTEQEKNDLVQYLLTL